MRKFCTGKPPRKQLRSLNIFHNGTACTFYFIYRNKEFTWITHGNNGQVAWPELQVCTWLHIAPRTARAWRNHQRQPDQNALLLLYLEMTGQLIPRPWSIRGACFVKGELHTRTGNLSLQDAESTDHKNWIIGQFAAGIEKTGPKKLRFWRD